MECKDEGKVAVNKIKTDLERIINNLNTITTTLLATKDVHKRISEHVRSHQIGLTFIREKIEIIRHILGEEEQNFAEKWDGIESTFIDEPTMSDDTTREYCEEGGDSVNSQERGEKACDVKELLNLNNEHETVVRFQKADPRNHDDQTHVTNTTVFKKKTLELVVEMEQRVGNLEERLTLVNKRLAKAEEDFDAHIDLKIQKLNELLKLIDEKTEAALQNGHVALENETLKQLDDVAQKIKSIESNLGAAQDADELGTIKGTIEEVSREAASLNVDQSNKKLVIEKRRLVRKLKLLEDEVRKKQKTDT